MPRCQAPPNRGTLLSARASRLLTRASLTTRHTCLRPRSQSIAHRALADERTRAKRPLTHCATWSEASFCACLSTLGLGPRTVRVRVRKALLEAVILERSQHCATTRSVARSTHCSSRHGHERRPLSLLCGWTLEKVTVRVVTGLAVWAEPHGSLPLGHLLRF